MRSLKLIAAAVAATLSVVAGATPTVNGVYDGDYGSAAAVQQNATGFGDNSDPTPLYANGSELDAAYGTVSGGRLYIFLAGNLESNFNKLDVFIATGAPGGHNQLVTIPNNQGNFNAMAGMTFDAGFNATNWISMTGGNANPDIFIDYANLLTGAANFSGQTTPGNGTLVGGNGGPTIEATWNNSNITGVTSSTAPNDAAAVLTGMEFSIALSDIGYTGGNILVSAFINGQNHDYASNQWLGGLPAGTGNLGGNGSGVFTGNLAGVNLNNFAGNQFFVVAVPEPASIGMLGLCAVLGLRRKR